MKRGAVPGVAAAAAIGGTLILVATLNCGGYRYGIGDQAFYIPAVLLDLDPALFPRDRLIIDAQDPLMAFDEVLAGIAAGTGMSLPLLFFVLYLAGLALLAWAAMKLSRALAFGNAATAAFLALVTLKHRVTQTGVNTLEGYLHPRMLAFAAGALATSLVVTGRTAAALLVALAAMFVHPTTGFWFVLLVIAAAIATDARSRRPLAALVAAGAVIGGAALWAGPFASRLIIMDEPWVRLLEQKDYLFPDAWGPGPWLVNTGMLAAAVAIYQYRARSGRTAARERGLVVGLICIVLLFLLSVPFIAARLALAVQLQTSRAFWLVDFVAMAYLGWLVTESPGIARLRVRTPHLSWIVAGALAAAAVSRGVYVTYFEHANRGAFAVDLPDDEWTDVMRWLRTRPRDVHVLADPGHAWRYGSSVRVAGERDVLLEEQKDGALALYSRDVASRVLDRIAAIGRFEDLTAQHGRDLAGRYDLDLLITEKSLALPVVYKNTRFLVYELPDAQRSGHHRVTSDPAR